MTLWGYDTARLTIKTESIKQSIEQRRGCSEEAKYAAEEGGQWDGGGGNDESDDGGGNRDAAGFLQGHDGRAMPALRCAFACAEAGGVYKVVLDASAAEETGGECGAGHGTSRGGAVRRR